MSRINSEARVSLKLKISFPGLLNDEITGMLHHALLLEYSFAVYKTQCQYPVLRKKSWFRVIALNTTVH